MKTVKQVQAEIKKTQKLRDDFIEKNKSVFDTLKVIENKINDLFNLEEKIKNDTVKKTINRYKVDDSKIDWNWLLDVTDKDDELVKYWISFRK